MVKTLPSRRNSTHNRIGESLLRLDEIYQMIAYIYHQKSLSRSPGSIFAQLVEVCGLLALHDGPKAHTELDITDALCQAVSGYFTLIARLKVKSVEELIYRKFPGICPYCRQSPHNGAQCKAIKHNAVLYGAKLAITRRSSWTRRPKGLDEWQAMFQTIYPRKASANRQSTIGLLEELGELAEALRVFDLYPHYLLGEAADVFSYLMGIANEHTIHMKAINGARFSLEKEFLARYPGVCLACGDKVCACQGFSLTTVAHLAKEIPIPQGQHPFFDGADEFLGAGARVAKWIQCGAD